MNRDFTDDERHPIRLEGILVPMSYRHSLIWRVEYTGTRSLLSINVGPVLLLQAAKKMHHYFGYLLGKPLLRNTSLKSKQL